MATLHITVRRLYVGVAEDGRTTTVGHPVPASIPVDKQSITTSGSSQASTIVANALARHVWDITVTGGNVYLKFGSAPTAAAGDDTLLLDGQTRQFGASGVDEKVAVINA